jgi:hypothetical protein
MYFGFIGVHLTVAVKYLFAGNGGCAIAGNDDTDEIYGVCGGYVDNGRAVASACSAEGLDCFRERVLFAAETREEAATTDFSAGFKSAEDTDEVPPSRGVGFAGEDISEEDAVTS